MNNMTEVIKIESLDILAFTAYFLALSYVGFQFGKNSKSSSSDYFLASKSLPWYVVGSSYIAANISTEHFIGLVGAALLYGVSVATGEWSTVIAFSFLIWLFIPYLLSSKVHTAPEFLELRFNPKVRLIFSTISILANVFAFMGPVIYGGALILQEFFAVNMFWACIIVGITSGGFAIWGGLRSVAFMDVVTIIIMVLGGLAVTFFGLHQLGDGQGIFAGFAKLVKVNQGNEVWSAEWISQNVPNILKGSQKGDEYSRLSVVQPLNHYSNPWTHWVFSFFYIGLWYTVINQTMIQKVLGAKDMYHARMGMVLSSFLKLFLPVIVVFPGLIYFAMKPDMLSNPDWSIVSDEANKTYIKMINLLIPTFLKGVLLAALFGAIQSTVSAVVNSTSTLFTMDLYKQYFNKDDNDQHYVKTGKWAGLTFLLLSIGFAVILGTVTKVNLFILIQAMYTFIAPPFSAIFLLGIFWKRVNGTDALVTIFVSFLVAGFLKYLEFGPLADSTNEIANMVKPFANQALITWIIAMVTCTIMAFLTPAAKPEQTTPGLIFSFSGSAFKEGLGNVWYKSVGFWWSLCVLFLIIIVILFSVVLK